MCYSAQIQAEYKSYLRNFGAAITMRDYVQLYWDRSEGRPYKIPKAMDAAFAHPTSDDERRIKTLIDEFNATVAAKVEQDIFKQRKRLVDAERTLLVKTTKKALEDQRIASAKVAWGLGKLADLKRTELKDRDSRIFPGWYAPVLVVENGQRVVKPMRYQCRPAGRPAFYDTKYPGTYNARRNNLEGFWQSQFGVTHGIMVVNAFYENVSRHRVEGRELGPDEVEQGVVLEFRPSPTQDILVACLWSRWAEPGQPELLSFAAITDDPPPEVAAAGHDRCIIPIKPEHVDAWLNPDPGNLDVLYAILDDRQRPYYERRLAA